MQHSLPVIFGLAGTSLSPAEQSFFKQHPPFGFILFARNIENRQQLIALTESIYQLHPEKKTWIFIDQEGGRVRRLIPPLVHVAPPMAAFVACHRDDATKGQRALEIYGTLQGAELNGLGINANCVPVLDIRFPWAHDIIGDRAFGEDSEEIIKLADYYLDALMNQNILPVMKHIPGHGRALVDSHEALPLVPASLQELQASDFLPFRHFAKKIPLAMTAHVVYQAIDDKPATLSKKIIDDVIRGWMGFDGLLMTDDLSMQALQGDMVERSYQSFAAGCDLLLHCNGKLEEMEMVMQAATEFCQTPHGKKNGESFKKSCQYLANLSIAWQRKTKDLSLDEQTTYHEEMIGLLSPHWQP